MSTETRNSTEGHVESREQSLREAEMGFHRRIGTTFDPIVELLYLHLRDLD